MKIEKRMEELGMEMPTARPVRANRVYAMRTGNIVYVSGSTANYPDGRRVMGKVGRDVTVDEAYEGARQAAVNLLASLKECIGDLDDVKQIVKLLCLVNTAEEFYDAPSVLWWSFTASGEDMPAQRWASPALPEIRASRLRWW